MMRGVKKSRASEVSPKDFTPEEWDEKMKMSAGDVKRCAASVMRYVKFCSRYLGVFLGLVKRLLGDFKRGGMEIGQNSVRTLVTKLEEIKKSWCGEESSKKSDEPELGSVSKRLTTRIIPRTTAIFPYLCLSFPHPSLEYHLIFFSQT